MLAWGFAVVVLGLFGVLLRVWLEFVKRERQLIANQQRVQEMTQAHVQALESLRARTSELEQETEASRQELEDCEQSVLKCREQLTELEEREERRSPTRHRIDMDREGGDDPA